MIKPKIKLALFYQIVFFIYFLNKIVIYPFYETIRQFCHIGPDSGTKPHRPIQSQRRFSHDTPLERIHGFRKGARLQKRSTASGNA